MEQMEIGFNSRPKPGELFAYGTQNYRVYEQLLQGPVNSRFINHDMDIPKYTSRITDVRHALAPHLIRVEAKRIIGGLWEYRLKDAIQERAAA